MTILISIYTVWPTFCVTINFQADTFPRKICQSYYVQVNSLIQPFLYFAINRRLQEDLIRKMQFCSSRETNDVTRVPKLTIWQTSPSFNTDISILVDMCNVSINRYCYQLYPIWKCDTNLSTQRRSNLALDINLCRTKSKKPKERKTRRRWFVTSPRKEAIG